MGNLKGFQERKRKHNKLSDRDIRVLRAMHAAGATRVQIARALGVTREHVHRLLHQYQLTQRAPSASQSPGRV